MDVLEPIRVKIPQFPGYGDETDRGLADELIRSYVGEALSVLQARLEPAGEPGDRLEALLIRAGFTNQEAFRLFEYVELDEARLAAMAAADEGALGVADRAAEIIESALEAYMEEVAAAFDARDRVMKG